jgi:large subunit ribosomal protein L46
MAGEKTFFMKARIMAGQADITANELGVEDFKWLAKEEVQKEVSPPYWAHIKNMLVEQ